MRAVTLPEVPGRPLVTEVPKPHPGVGEVLVKVAASSLNGYDAGLADGLLLDRLEHRFPLVPGMDFAGTVEAIGEGATRFTVGEAVFGVVSKPYVGDGSFAEYVTVPEHLGVARVPAGVTLSDAGALGLAGTAALDCIEAVSPGPGEQLLISGATGGVGAFALQYALDAGAEVIATARPGRETEFVRELGGERVLVVDHTGDLLYQVRQVAPEGVPAALHLAGNGTELAELVRAGGRMASTLGFGPDQAPGRGFGVTAVTAFPVEATLNRLAADVAVGRLRVPVTRTYAMGDVGRALDDFAAGTLGKLALALP